MRMRPGPIRPGTQRAGRAGGGAHGDDAQDLTDGGQIDHLDFLDRVDILGALGKTVLISNFAEFHRLAAYLFSIPKR